MHISDQIRAALIADMWTTAGYAEQRFTKRIEGFAEAGQLSTGTRVVTLMIDASGRWFERRDGWGKVERDLDLRDYTDAATAIAAIMEV